MMLAANWGRQGPSLVMGVKPDPDPTIDGLGLSSRVLNALKANYHGWWDWRYPDCSDPCELPAPPLIWLKGIMAKPEMLRNLYHVGRKGYLEIEQALEGV